MRVPEYYYAKPRYDFTALPAEQANKQAEAWSFLPSSVYEFSTVTLSLVSAGFLNARYGARLRPGFASAWKYPLAYIIGLSVARWSDRVSLQRYSYEDRVVREYMDLHPDRFPEYKPKKMKETFGSWYPIRSGHAGSLKETAAIGRTKDTDHYVPNNDESKA